MLTSASKHYVDYFADLDLTSVFGATIIFTQDDVEEIINLQPKGTKAKAYQVKQVRNLILKYRLGDVHDSI